MRQSEVNAPRDAEAVAPREARSMAARLVMASTIDGLLEKVSFSAPAGEVTAVYGPAGAGKTALADVLRLAKRVTAGGCDVLGENALRLNATQRARLKRRIGVVGQSPVLFDHLSAVQNVLAPLRLMRRLGQDDERDAAEVASYLGLKMRDDRPVAFMSGSERRRVAVARAVAQRPDLLIADEPCAGLAPDAAGRVLKLLLQSRKSGTAVLILTQDEDLAASLPGAQWRMSDGIMSPPGHIAATP